MNSPARFDIDTSTPSRMNQTQRVEQHLDGLRVVAHRRGGVPDSRDRPVMVGAPDVDEVLEAAAELLGHVADVGREVGWPAVGSDDHPVLVVAEGGRPEPQRAVLLIEMAARPEPLDRPLDPALGVERTLRSSRRRNGRRAARGSPRCLPGPERQPSARRRPPDRRRARLRPRDLVRDDRPRAPRRRRRGSRPRAPARPSRIARIDAPRFVTCIPESLK